MTTTLLQQFTKPYLKTNLPDIRSGDIVRVHQKIREGNKERVQTFEGIVIARKHGVGINATFTVRKIVAGVGVEKTYPLHSPTLEKIEILRRSKVRRAKLYYLRTAKGKRTRLKFKEYITPEVEIEPLAQIIPTEESPAPEEKTSEE